MPFLLRVELPDVPGSLGRLATAIGEAGGDIEAIEIVEKRYDGTAVDDVLARDGRRAPCPTRSCRRATDIEGVEVLWISRYAAGGNIFLDLEAVEELTAAPRRRALDRLVDLLPIVFRSDWGARVDRSSGVRRATEAAPETSASSRCPHPGRSTSSGADLVVACPLGADEVLLIGRRGGPAFLDSELARLAHLANLARSIAS